MTSLLDCMNEVCGNLSSLLTSNIVFNTVFVYTVYIVYTVPFTDLQFAADTYSIRQWYSNIHR